MPELNPPFKVPGPGTAMALAAAVSIYSAAIVEDTDSIKYFMWITLIFIAAACFIEYMHITEDKIKARYTEDIFLFLIIVMLGIGLTHFMGYLLLN